MAPFKALLVLRAVLQAQENPADWGLLMELQSHKREHEELLPAYVEEATTVSQWIVDECITDEERSFICEGQRKDGNEIGDVLSLLCDIFCMIHVNAIGLGPHAVGLFPGLPSMVNHSCNENITHSWDANENSDDPCLRFRAVEPINVDEECCFSYVSELEHPTPERVESLKKFKFFICNCPRCKSDDEEGRLESLREWKECVSQLEKGDSKTDATASPTVASLVERTETYRKLCALAESIFPQYFVTKGLTFEECAHSIKMVIEKDNDESNQQKLKEEMFLLFRKAREQYIVCRGDKSPFVKRIDEAMSTIDHDDKEQDVSETGIESVVSKCEDYNDIAENDTDDLILSSGWCRTLFEIKTMEPLSEEDLSDLARRIREDISDKSVIRWTDDHRMYELGYGIKTLILSCEVDESTTSKESVAETIEESMVDIIQNVDIIHNNTSVV